MPELSFAPRITNTMRLPAFLTAVAPLLTTILPAKDQNVASKVSAAKVFLSGAQITRTASASVPAGSTTLIFTGLGQHLDPQSVQVNGKGGFSILSVNHRINYLSESPKKKEIEDLETKIKKLEKDWAFEKAMQQHDLATVGGDCLVHLSDGGCGQWLDRKVVEQRLPLRPVGFTHHAVQLRSRHVAGVIAQARQDIGELALQELAGIH